MATVSQIKIQIDAEAKYKGGEPILPQPPTPPASPLLILSQGSQPDGTDFGVVKVEEGKLVFDMDEFNADFGVF